MILVTGATGTFGSRTVGRLAAAGHRVRALVRRPEKAEAIRGPNVELAVGDFDQPATLRAAVAGVEAVFLVSPMDPALASRERAVVDAARAAGVARLVKVHGAVRHKDALAASHESALDAITRSGLEWTLVSPSSVIETALLSQTMAVRMMGMLFGAAGDARVGLVAADDIARVAAHVLTTPGHAGQNYELTGPETLTFADIADRFTRVLGRPIRYQDLTDAELTGMLVEHAHMTPAQVELQVLCHYRAFRAGGADFVTDTYQRLLGEPPTSVETWIRANAAAFAP
jgi:uncharacterized protein YbjT (DUF2867 family)